MQLACIVLNKRPDQKNIFKDTIPYEVNANDV